MDDPFFPDLGTFTNGLPALPAAAAEDADEALWQALSAVPLAFPAEGSNSSGGGGSSDDGGDSPGGYSDLLLADFLAPGPGKVRAAVRKCHATTAQAFLDALTPDERRMLAAEGTAVPTHSFALTKAEQRELRQGLRKVRNKLSALDSRQRKKAYVTDLEARVDQVTVLNLGLADKVATLERENRSLLQQLHALQQRVAAALPAAPLPAALPAATATGRTCLMVLMVCFALWAAPGAPAAGSAAAALPAGVTMQPTFRGRVLLSLAPENDIPGGLAAAENENDENSALSQLWLWLWPTGQDNNVPADGNADDWPEAGAAVDAANQSRPPRARAREAPPPRSVVMAVYL